jgi:hypothetical protein
MLEWALVLRRRKMGRGSFGGVSFGSGWMYNNPDLEYSICDPMLDLSEHLNVDEKVELMVRIDDLELEELAK